MGYRIQATSINVARAVYALNWFNIAPGLKYIASDFRFQIIQLGIITTAFYIGLSTFQMVGGLLSGRIGNKNTAVLGIAILGVSVITTGLSGNLFELFVSRLFAGIGSALFFSPALGLLADIVPKGSYSFYVGMFNGSFNLGGGVGIIGWALLDQVYGWRAPLVLAGIIMLSIALENLVVLRKFGRVAGNSNNLVKRARVVLKGSEIWLLPVIAMSAIFSETVIGQLFVYYAEVHMHYSPNLAGSLGTVYLLIGFFGGTMGGYIFGKIRRKIMMFVASALILSVLTAMVPLTSSYVLLFVLMMALGIMTVNGFSMLYTIIIEKTKDRGMISFALSFVNFLQIAVGAFSPALFSVLSFYHGYVVSWVTLGILGAASASAGILMRGEIEKEARISSTNI